MHIPAQRRQQLADKAYALEQHLHHALPYLTGRGISEQAARMFHLGVVPDGQQYAGRLSIPYVTPHGVVQIKYRCADPEHHDGVKHIHASCPKYLYEAGLGAHLYNAQVLIGAADAVVLLEGELDALCVQAYTGLPAVGFPGTETWQKHPHWRMCFESVSEVIVVNDGDEAGRNAAAQVVESLGSTARIVDLPDGQDANSYIASFGPGAFEEMIFDV